MIKKLNLRIKEIVLPIWLAFYKFWQFLSNDINIVKQFVKYDKNKFFYDLGPKENIEDGEIYFNRFMTAVNKGNKTIAVTGRYGIGKTSIINYILSKFEGIYKSIRITLGTYEIDKHSSSTEEIEMKILQQIIYTEDEKKLPRSRFKRIKYISSKDRILLYLCSLFLFVLLNIYFPEFFNYLFVPFFNNVTEIFSDKLGSFLCYVYFIILVYLFECFLIFLYSTLDITLFKYKNLEISIGKRESQSVFNKYLDEIVYFFKKTKTHFLVVEDLDRYETKISLEIFRKLKELNYMLNCNKTIKKNGGVIFIYCLRDDLFSKCEDRVKFFDCIIPVVSRFSRFNSKQYIIELYSEFEESYNNSKNNSEDINGDNDLTEKKLSVQIDPDLFSVLGMYIQDRRLLLNIFMEFKMFIDVLNVNQNLNFTQLFALISYKNINPKNFEERVNFEGNLYNIFDLKDEFINLLNDSYTKKIKELNTKLAEMECNRINDYKIVKKSFVYDVIRRYNISSSNFSNLYICFGDKEYFVNDFIESDINFSGLNKIDMFYKTNGKTKINSELVDEFIKKITILKYDFDSVEQSVLFYQKKINDNKKATLMEILNNDNIKSCFSSPDLQIQEKINEIFKDKILVAFVKNGFIKENYETTLSFFKSGDLSDSDYSFLISVDVGDKLNYDFNIVNIDNVIDMIELNSFDKEAVLNFSLCDFFINNEKSKISNYDDKRNKFFSHFKSINDFKFKFLDLYYLYSHDNFSKLIKIVFDDNIFSYYCNYENFSSDKNSWLKILIENVNLNLSDNNRKNLKKILENNPMLLNDFDIDNAICMKNIESLSVEFEDYSKFNNNLITKLYLNDIYVPNRSFYNKLINIYEVESLYINSNVLDLLAENPKFIKFAKKVLFLSNFEDFYNSFVIFESSVYCILNIVNTDIPITNKLLILEKEKEKIDEIFLVLDKSLWKIILERKLCNINLKNILDYYGYIEHIDDLILKLLSNFSSFNVIHENLETFEKDFLYTKYCGNLNYIDLAESSTYIFKEFDDGKNVNTIYLSNLICSNKVELNINTYNFLLEKKLEKELINLVKFNVDEFISIIEDIEISSRFIDNVLLTNISGVEKVKILENINVGDISKDVLNKVTIDIIDDNASISDTLCEKIFELITTENKMKLFRYLYDLDKKYIKYFYKIDSAFKNIRNGSSFVANFPYTKSLEEFFLYLRSKYLINSVKNENGNLRITFAKRKF